MADASTLVGVVLAFALGTVAGLALAARRKPKAKPDHQAAYLRRHAVRLAVAQHWARGGALSERSEPWRPICTGIAVAALMVDDDADVLALLEKAIGESGTDPELANVWRQARAELIAAREHLQTEFLCGTSSSGAPAWNQPELRARASELLDSAQTGAMALLAARRVPSVPPPHN